MIDLQVEVERTQGFTGAVRVYAAWTPPGVTVAVPLVIPAGETAGIYRLRSSGSVEPGTYPITLTAQEDKGGNNGWGTGFHFVASPPIDLQVVRPYLDIQLSRSAIERQKTGEIKATIKTISPLPGNATARLVRLPKGVELIKPITIKPGDTEATFPVRVTRGLLNRPIQRDRLRDLHRRKGPDNHTANRQRDSASRCRAKVRVNPREEAQRYFEKK